MVIQKLNLFEKKEEQETEIKFDELMDCDGIWKKNSRSYESDKCRKCDYGSGYYIYYVYQDYIGGHTFLRNKK